VALRDLGRLAIQRGSARSNEHGRASQESPVALRVQGEVLLGAWTLCPAIMNEDGT